MRTPTPPPEEVDNYVISPLKNTDETSRDSPRKRRRKDYALGLGDGREYVVAKMLRENKPKVSHLLAAIMERDPTQRAKNWDAQRMATWLHEHPVNKFYQFSLTLYSQITTIHL